MKNNNPNATSSLAVYTWAPLITDCGLCATCQGLSQGGLRRGRLVVLHKQANAATALGRPRPSGPTGGFALGVA